MEPSEPLILIVEDDENDQTFIQRALKRSGVANRIVVVNDGEQAIAYLRGFDVYADRTRYPLPRLIFADLKMPRMGGIELLKWLNSGSEFRLIPTIVLTSSTDQADITAAFVHGAKGYMIKPVQFAELEQLMKTIAAYWRACVCRALAPVEADTTATAPRSANAKWKDSIPACMKARGARREDERIGFERSFVLSIARLGCGF